VPSVWITPRLMPNGQKRHRVYFRPGGREATDVYAGSFKTRKAAQARKAYILGELAQMRMPNLTFEQPASVPTFTEAGERWRASRVDASEGTRIQQRTSLNRALRILGKRRIDTLTAQDIAAMVATLHAAGLKPSFIRKILQATAMVFDHAGVRPNPARDKVIVRLPREEPERFNPPSAEHVTAVYRLLPSKHRLALLWLDWSGQRVSSIDHTLVSDYDEPRHRVCLRAKTTKTRRALWRDLPPVLADAIEQTMGPREDRDPAARLFAPSGAER
jgi:hypothetical protein